MYFSNEKTIYEQYFHKIGKKKSNEEMILHMQLSLGHQLQVFKHQGLEIWKTLLGEKEREKAILFQIPL